MRPRLVMLLSFAVAAVAIAFTGARFTILPSPPPAHATLPHKLASYLGVYEPHAPPSFQPIAEFGRAAGRQPNLVEYYSGWAEPFALSFARTAFSHGVIPFVQIDPTFASVSAIAAGVYDHPYLIAFADSVREFGHPVVIGFGHEMNYEKQAWGFGHVPPATFVAAWRHIVTLFRSQGAENVTWLWTLQADGPQTGPIQNWWPGDAYVSWVGIDGYYYRPSDTFASIFGETINQVRGFTSKPVLLSETAVGPAAGQFLKIQNLFSGMSAYKTLGLVWFDKTQHNGIYHQNWRIEGNARAEYAFQLGVSNLTLAAAPSH